MNTGKIGMKILEKKKKIKENRLVFIFIKKKYLNK